MGGWGAPNGDDRIADELIDGAPVAPDDFARGLKVTGQKVAHVLRVAHIGKGGEPDQIGEEHRHQPPLGGRRDGRLARSRAEGGRVSKGSAAFATKTLTGLVGSAARRTGRCQRTSALCTKLAVRSVLRLTVWTDHCWTTPRGVKRLAEFQLADLISLPRSRGRVGWRLCRRPAGRGRL